jgi:hypothetical protein
MEDMKSGFAMKHRSLSFGKGDGGMGRNDFDTSLGSLIGLLLRRTLVRSVILFIELLTAKSQRIC